VKTVILKARFLKALKVKDLANVYRFRDLLKVARISDSVVYEWVKKDTQQKIGNEELDELVQKGKSLYEEKTNGDF
jgi:ribonuclease HI